MTKNQKKIYIEKLLQNEKELGCQSILDSKYIVKQETPHSFLNLEEELNQFYSEEMELEEAINEGTRYLEEILKILIDCKVKFREEFYPKLRELYSYLDQEWMAKERMKQLHGRDKFRKLFDIYITRIDLVIDLFIRTKQENLIQKLPTWWAYRNSLQICEKIGKYENENADKKLMLSFYSLSSMISSLYWNEKTIVSCTETINQTTKKILFIYSEVERLRSINRPKNILYFATKYIDLDGLRECENSKEKAAVVSHIKNQFIPFACEKLYEFFNVSNEIEYNLWLMIGRIWTAENDLASEFVRKIPLEYIPDNIRKYIKQIPEIKQTLLAEEEKTRNEIVLIKKYIEKLFEKKFSNYPDALQFAEVMLQEKISMTNFRLMIGNGLKQNPLTGVEIIRRIELYRSNTKPPGRPKGSTKKAAVKKRGRPAGSKNKGKK